ncbi:hypothetical protein G9444_2509 [Rhodococcus erythropolis]|uniref:Uncharacterized protein n=1 Tax=Rhodococcus erythropolis TaxID=1833 RepID=A0A6G9CRS8_RHOER|nr:hypothetical protein G9444_2450 [Rhodococcus erythropolis]QIP39753.1 hypothetical protein G9444_2509 [Rhodococcus erythropolis]
MQPPISTQAGARSGTKLQEAHMIEFLLITWALIRFWIL